MPSSLVKDYMTTKPVTLLPQAPLREAVELVMVRRIRHIPIIAEDGKLVGIVTDRDVKRSLPSPLSMTASYEYETILESTPIEKIMTRDPSVIDPDDTMINAVQTLLDRKIGGLPVVKDGLLIGMLTERDMLKHYLKLLQVQ
ncbi:MAG: CBS domain-containing protein [Vicinamibacteria bacterium]|nr:CBS domain-containing protein [Vicinamibacteria bacterium]